MPKQGKKFIVPTIWKVQIETLTEEVQLKTIEKNGIEFREKLKLLALFAAFALSGFPAAEKIG